MAALIDATTGVPPALLDLEAVLGSGHTVFDVTAEGGYRKVILPFYHLFPATLLKEAAEEKEYILDTEGAWALIGS